MTQATALAERLCLSPTFLPQDWEILARHWYPIARVVDVDDQPMAVRLLDVPLVLWRSETGFSLALDRCPHRGVPLSKGSVRGGQTLVCAYHGLHFNGAGACTRIPAQPSLQPSERFHLHSFPLQERYGLLWTCLSPVGEVDIPTMPSWDMAGHQQILPPYVDIQGSAGRQVEGFVDVAHFAFIHPKAFADPDNPAVPPYTVRVDHEGIHSDYLSTVSNYPKGLQHLAPDGFLWRRVFTIYPPFAARLTVHFPEDGLLNILNLASPMTATSTRLFVPITRNFDTNGALEDVYAFNAQIFAEDQEMVESQWPKALPLDPDAESHFAADRASVAYRRWLRGMGLQFS